MLPEVEWVDMFIGIQIIGGLLLAAFMWSIQRKDDE